MPDSRAFFKHLVLIFNVPNLYCSGACLIPSSTSFFPNSEFSALAPTSSPLFNRPVEVRAFEPSFTMFPKRLPPCCCVLQFLCLLGQICCVLVMITFLGRSLLLTLSYLARNDCTFGNVTRHGAMHRPNNIFCLSILTEASTSFISTKYLFYYWASYST